MTKPQHPTTSMAVASAIGARCAELGMKQAELVRASHLSDPTIRRFQRGDTKGTTAATRQKLALALGWTPDSIDRLLAGLDARLISLPPADLSSATASTLLSRLDGLEASIASLQDEIEALALQVHGVAVARGRQTSANRGDQVPQTTGSARRQSPR